MKKNTLLNKISATKYLLFTSLVFYFLSVSRFSVSILDNKLYFIKHFIILLPAIFVLFEYTYLRDLKISKKNIIHILLLTLIISPFFIRGIFDFSEIIIFFQIFLFLLSCYFYSYYFKSISNGLKKSDFWFLILIFLTPLFLNVISENANFIYNTYYGRPRLLLGYFHPKEGAICLVIILLFFQLYFKKFFTRNFIIIFNILTLILLYLMQSRNVFIFYMNFLVLNLLITHFNIKFVLFLYFILPILIVSVFIFFYFKEVNVLLSNRLEWWLKNIKITPLGSGSNISNYTQTSVLSKLHVDNFYLEYLIENGYLLFGVLLFVLYRFVVILNKIKIKHVYINSIFISFLFFCFFDAGMFSSGNLLNFLVWVIVFTAIDSSTKTGFYEAI